MKYSALVVTLFSALLHLPNGVADVVSSNRGLRGLDDTEVGIWGEPWKERLKLAKDAGKDLSSLNIQSVGPGVDVLLDFEGFPDNTLIRDYYNDTRYVFGVVGLPLVGLPLVFVNSTDIANEPSGDTVIGVSPVAQNAIILTVLGGIFPGAEVTVSYSYNGPSGDMIIQISGPNYFEAFEPEANNDIGCTGATFCNWDEVSFVVPQGTTVETILMARNPQYTAYFDDITITYPSEAPSMSAAPSTSSQPSSGKVPSSRPSDAPSISLEPTTSASPTRSVSPSASPSSSPTKFCRKDVSGFYPTGKRLILRKGESSHNSNKAGDDEAQDDEAGIINKTGGDNQGSYGNKHGSSNKNKDNNNNKKSNSGSFVLDPVSCHQYLVKNLPYNKYGALKTRCDQEGIYDHGKYNTGKKVRDICICECEDV